MCKYARNRRSNKANIPSSLKEKQKRPGTFVKMQRVARLRLVRDRTHDDTAYGVISRLMRVQLLNQCAHRDRAPTVKLRKKELLTKHHAHERKVKRKEDRNFHQRTKT